MTLFKAIAYHLRRRSAPTTFQWIKGHDGHIGNEQADQLAMAGALRTDPDQIDTYVPRNFDVQGAKIEYKRATLALLDITRFAVEAVSSKLETDETIWRSCRNKDISKNIQMFRIMSTEPSAPNAQESSSQWNTY